MRRTGSVSMSLLWVSPWLSSTKFTLNSCSQSWNSRNRSLHTSSRPSFLFLIFCFCWFMRRVSPQLLTRTSTSFGYCSVYLLTSKMESCDQDDGEVGEGVWRKKSLMNQEPQMVHGSIFCNHFSFPFW